MTPAYRLQVAGNDLPVPPLSIEITDKLGSDSDALRITLPGRDASGEFVRQPRHGIEITAALGFEGQPLQDFGTFVVSAVALQGPPDVATITATTPELLGSIKAPRSRSWDDITLPDLLASIVQPYGLIPLLSESLRAIRIEHIDQDAESDLAFLTRVARRNNGVFSIKNHRAMIIKVGDGRRPSGAAVMQHDVQVDDGSVLTWDANFLDRPNYSKVVARWTDFAGGEVRSVSVGDGEPVYEMRHPYTSEAEALLAAQAELDAFTREVADLSLSLPGRPEIRAGNLVNCVTGRLFGGIWYVAEAQHSYAAGGLTTRLNLNAHNSDR